MEHILRQHPPRSGSLGLSAYSSSAAKLKICYKRALLSYHQDKQVAQDMKWQVLCEEISKVITIIYNNL